MKTESLRQNEGAILVCLDKLIGKLDKGAMATLNDLKTQIEIVYGLKKSQLNFRELKYKTAAGDKWRLESFLMTPSVWGKERYTLKFYKLEANQTWPETASPTGQNELAKSDLLKFAQNSTITEDSRWEEFLVPGDPKVTFKSLNFKLYELKAKNARLGRTLNCSMGQEEYFCRCL